MSENIPEEALTKLPFRDANLDIEKRVEDLLSKLTLRETLKLSSGTSGFSTKLVKN